MCFFYQSSTCFTKGVKWSNGYFKENYNFPRFQSGFIIFRGGGEGGSNIGGGGGSNANFYRNPYNL